MNSIGPVTAAANSDLESTFKKTVGTVFYGQLLKSLRSTVGKPAYIHGGQAEEMFQAQLDQTVADSLSDRNSGPWLDELFTVFQAQLDARSPLAAAQPSQLLQSEQSAGAAPLAQLTEAARQTQPASHAAGMTTGTAALSALIRK